MSLLYGPTKNILYGVNKTTLDAYLKAERAKVWEEAAILAEQFGVHPQLNIANGGPAWYQHGREIAAMCRRMAAKETP